jgi:hypothetical protein
MPLVVIERINQKQPSFEINEAPCQNIPFLWDMTLLEWAIGSRRFGTSYSLETLVSGKVKVKFTLEQTTKAQRGLEVWLYSFFDLGARWGGW